MSGTQQIVNIREIVESCTPLISQFIKDNYLDPYALESIQKEFWVVRNALASKINFKDNHIKFLNCQTPRDHRDLH